MRSKLMLLLLVSMLLAVMAAPAHAAEEPVGERINVLGGFPATFAANEPFHIAHGWFDEPANAPVGRFGFMLDVAGESMGRGSLLNTGPGLTGGNWARLWLYNFPEGMPEGEVTFTGHWFAPCSYAVETLGYPGPCATPNEMVDVLTLDHTVTFS